MSRKKKIVGIITIEIICLICIGGVIYFNNSKTKTVYPEVVMMNPTGIMVSSDGQIIVSDEGKQNVVRLKNNKTYLVAGLTLPSTGLGKASYGYRDGPFDQCLFHNPFALAEWKGGIVVSDTGNNCLRYIKDDQVMTLTGTTEEGSRDGKALEATFNQPKGIVVDSNNNIYVADSGNGLIRKISSEGQVTTLINGLDTPVGLWYDIDTLTLYITDVGRNQILSFSDNEVHVIAGMAYQDEAMDLIDGDAEYATFSSPSAIIKYQDRLYIADTGFSAIREIYDSQVKTLIQLGDDGHELWPANPIGLAISHQILYVVDSFAQGIYQYSLVDSSPLEEGD